MSLHLTIEYKVTILAELTNNLKQTESYEGITLFNAGVKDILGKYRAVKLDPNYKRYGLDIGIVSESTEQLDNACYDICMLTRESPLLKSIMFDSFEFGNIERLQ